jgi:2-aminoadipate transaminase
MLPISPLNPDGKSPLFRQLHEQMKGLIGSGVLQKGSRLPATRELAGQLGLNRTTVSAAYALLESEGLIAGHVGRGSFVTGGATAPHEPPSASFSRSRPSELLFPLEEFRKPLAEVILSDDAADHLATRLAFRLSSAAPLSARSGARGRHGAGIRRHPDYQRLPAGFRLLQRTCPLRATTVLIEDPVYLGVRNVFERAGARLIGFPWGRTAWIWKAWSERIVAGSVRGCFASRPIFKIRPAPPCRWPRARILLRITQAAGVS